MTIRVPDTNVVWTLGEALERVRATQPMTRDYGYHLCLGGGVLNNGLSMKDVDLYFLPLCNKETTAPEGLFNKLVELWGPAEPIGDYGLDQNRLKVMFTINGKRADVFIWLLKGEENASWLSQWITEVSKTRETSSRKSSTLSGRVKVSVGLGRRTSY